MTATVTPVSYPFEPVIAASKQLLYGVRPEGGCLSFVGLYGFQSLRYRSARNRKQEEVQALQKVVRSTPMAEWELGSPVMGLWK